MFNNTQEDNTENKFRKTGWEMSTCSIVFLIGLDVGVLRTTFDAIKTKNFFIATRTASCSLGNIPS